MPKATNARPSADAPPSLNELSAPRPPTVAIYQNPEHVSGILQQLDGAPLPTSSSTEDTSEKEQSLGKVDGTKGAVKAEMKMPGVAVAGDVGGNTGEEQALRDFGASRVLNEYRYSQAYYLHRVRNELHRRGLITVVASAADAQELRSGHFVEYEAKFEPDQLSAILDVLTPDLVAEGVRFLAQSKLLAEVKSTNTGKREVEMAHKDAKEAAWTSVARSLTQAARADFRSERTREYYGSIADEAGGDPVIAITICDSEHFVVSDQDRILDGRFTVLGKVTEELAQDRPILERNKLLDKLNPALVDELADTLNSSLEEQATKAVEESPGEIKEVTPFKGGVNSRIPGSSFRVIPLAIFA